MELDPQPYSNTKEMILYNMSDTDGIVVQVSDLYGIPASANLNFDRTSSYNGQPGGSLAYQDPPGTTIAVTQDINSGPPIDSATPDFIIIDPSALSAPVTGAAGSNTAGDIVFTDPTVGAFVGVAVGWQLYIDGSATPFQISAVIDPNNLILSTPIPEANAGVNWTASSGGPGPIPAITLTADANAIVATGTSGVNAAGGTTFTDAAVNAFAGVVAGDSLYIGATAYPIAVVVSVNELTLTTAIPTANTAASWKVNKQYAFSAPTVAFATIKVNASPIPAGTQIRFNRPGRPAILLQAVNGAPPAFLPPINNNPGIAYFDGSGGIPAIALSIQRALNNIPAITSVLPPNVLTLPLACMPLGRADSDGIDTVTIYGQGQTGRVGTLDMSDITWASRTIQYVGGLFTIGQFAANPGTDANVWPDSPMLLYANTYASGIKNIMWNVYKALVDPGNGLTPYIVPQLPANISNDNTDAFSLTRTIKLVAAFNGTDGNNLTALGASTDPPFPPANPRRVYVNTAGSPDPENFAGGVDPLPTSSSVTLATGLYIPPLSAITLSIGSEGNRQPLATSQFWSQQPGSKLGIVLKGLGGEDVMCNVTFVQNRGYPDGV